MRRKFEWENFSSARRRRAISLSMLKVPNNFVNSLFSPPGELLVIFIDSATLVWWPAKGTYKLIENIS